MEQRRFPKLSSPKGASGMLANQPRCGNAWLRGFLILYVYPSAAENATFYTLFNEMQLPYQSIFDIMETIVEGYTMKRRILPDFSAARDRRLLVALSGGADSVALLCMLSQVREELNLTLCAAHVDHSIRGDASRADAEYCRELCAKLDVPIHIETVDVPAARQSGEGLETAARRLRYDALHRIKTQTGCEWIALAHHLDDQAETVLMHLLRGCGPDGIGGMEVLSGDLYRPLLHTPKAALEDYLTDCSIPWRTDSTNFDAFTPRNALRLHGLPALEESYPKAPHAIARYAEAAQCENRLMERLTAEFLDGHLQCGAYGKRILHPEEADEAILRRAIRRICSDALPHDRLLELVSLCRRARGRLEISGSLTIERTPDAIYFLPKRMKLPDPVALPEHGTVRFDPLGTLTVQPSQPIPVRNDPNRQILDRDALCGAVIRTRRDGDRIRPLGSGEKLLSDYFTDKKIDRPLRDFIPLAAVGNRILWAIGIGISEDAKLRPDSTAVQLTWDTDAFTSEK